MLDRLAGNIGRNRFLLMGRAGMDLMPTPPGTAIEEAERFEAALGGSAANTAAGIARLGGSAALLTCVSDDAIGRYCLRQLARYGIDATHVRAVGGEARNSLALSESRLEGHQTVIYRNGAADFEMSAEDVAGVDYAAFGALVTAGTVFAAEPSRSAAFDAFARAREAGTALVFDIDYRPYSWPSPAVAEEVLSRAGAMCDMVVGNEEEFGFMAGDPEAGLEMARRLSRESAAVVIYKMGPRGAITLAGGQETRTGIYAVEALKPTGAGDAFMAGLLTRWASGATLDEAVRAGTACAAITVTRPGCAPAIPEPGELDAFLRARGAPA